jgi:hypothetical protein
LKETLAKTVSADEETNPKLNAARPCRICRHDLETSQQAEKHASEEASVSKEVHRPSDPADPADKYHTLQAQPTLSREVVE